MRKENEMPDHKETPYIVVERQATGIGTFIWGALLGAGVALLFAPRTGRETRRELGDGLKRVRDSAEDAVQKVQQAVSGTVDELREQVNDRVDAAREAMAAGREAALRSRIDLDQRVRDELAMTPRPPFYAESIEEETYRGEDDESAKEIRIEP